MHLGVLQITAMEDEFAEIKTNILRTSARLDNLKAQTEELAPSIDWEVEEKEIEVEVPAADLEVEGFEEVAEEAPVEEEPVEEEAPVEEVEEPVEEEAPVQFEEVAVEEEPAKADDLFADTFFKDDLFAETPVEDDVAAIEEEPAEEAPAEVAEEAPAETIEEAPEHEATVEELLASMDALTEGETGIPAPEVAAEASEDVDALLDEISFDDLVEEVPAEAAEAVGEAVEAASEAAPEEISFDSLEALFKDEQ